MGEGEVSIDPPHFTLAKQMLSQFFEGSFQVFQHILLRYNLLRPSHPNSLHLMKHRVMIPINLISPIHIPKYQEVLELCLQVIQLMCTCMRSKEELFRDIVGI